MFYEAARSANWFARSPRSASTPADRSKRATQLSPWGCSARFVPAEFGPVGRSRTRNVLFGVRDGEKVVRCTRNAWFGVRGKGKVICECKPPSRQDCTESHISRGSVLRGLSVMLALGIVARRRRLT